MIVNAFARWSPLALGVIALACGPTRVRRAMVPSSQAATLDQKSPFLKAHLRSGYVYVLQSWAVDSAGTLVTGWGSLLNPQRTVDTTGEFRLPVDSVALFETNTLQTSGSVTALAVMTGITAAVAGVCLANPKSCFGSCPTFYVSDGGGPFLHAEGFSASVAPALEAADVDALYRARVSGREFRVQLRNEALETHVLRYADLLVVPRPAGTRVFVTPEGEFRLATAVHQPYHCVDAGGDCRQTVASFDGRERTSLADSLDLATREHIDLQFGALSGELGLVITFRQSLMSTYLLYQTLAYLGTQAPAALASLTNGGAAARERVDGMGKLLGRIEVLVPDGAGGWTSVGSAGETGPLAPDTKIVPLPATNADSVRIRLRLTRGLWRIDYLALVQLGKPVAPVRLPPSRVERSGRYDPAATRALVDSGRSLVTLPGDNYELFYQLPVGPQRYELFLESRGYYLEWMRREWLAEENLALAAQVLLDPAGSLRRLAPAFKRQEPHLERLFWNSRYVRR
jgi:hypothetical protein